MFNSLIKIVESAISEENITKIFSGILGNYKLEPSETHLFSVINIKKDGKTYIDICGMKYNATIEKWQINTIKETKLLSKLIKELIEHGKRNS
jgi:hypothetical protein